MQVQMGQQVMQQVQQQLSVTEGENAKLKQEGEAQKKIIQQLSMQMALKK
jgi:hypothetical protein